jgi:hypothetical protein
LCLGLLTLSGAAAMAQNSVTVMGSVTPCSGTSYPVWIFSDPGTTPAVDTVINTTVNCTYSYTFFPNNTSGGIAVLLSCDGGSTWESSDSATYTINTDPVDTLVMDLGCGGGTTIYDCLGIPNGPNVPGTACDDGNPGTTGDMWSPACVCNGTPVSTACQASFTVQQAMNGGAPIPWQMTTTNTSTGGNPLTFTWWMPDGSASYLVEPGFTFGQSGVYAICLTISADNGNCTSTLCDTVVVDSMGYISTNAVWYDCTGLLWGQNMPGTPCSTAFGQGTWSANCVCVPDTAPEPCHANFYAIQAYTDSTTNPGGGMEPIPNEVWVWNLSTGGNGDAQYLWNFGDGTTSTDAYPTHEYDGPGPWDLCLTITTGNCTDSYCDSVSVDENGILNGMVIDGHPADQDQRTNGFTLNVLQSAPTGMAETPAIADLHLWPNPAQNELNLTFNNALSGAVSLTVIDPSGRRVISEDHNLTAGPNTLQLNTASLEPGLYVVRIGNATHSVTHRFMKLR